MKKILLISCILFLQLQAYLQIPAGYYNGTENLSGTALRSALHNIIDNHTVVSYSSLWTHYQQTDKKPDNSVWDMYTDIPGGTPVYTFTFVTDQCGNYSQEGDCYNREHSWPQSWFNSASPMKTDLFQVYPTDGYVNGMRSNYPYGEVGTASSTSSNGSKLGNCVYPGYTGTVFEPIDEYKGDFARTYFYMSTRYYTEDASWQSNGMVSGADLLPWAQNMLMEWSVNDPVSAKEIARNNAVYAIQGNRNPYIDHPEFAFLIFSSNYPQPQFTTSPVETAMINSYYEYFIQATDANGNDLIFVAESLPTWLSLTDNGNNTASLTGTPQNGDDGSFSISIGVQNPYSLPVYQNYTLMVSPVTSVEEVPIPQGEFTVFPNPVKQELTIVLNDQANDRISIYDAYGSVRVQFIKEANRIYFPVNTSDWPSGIYFIKASNDRNESRQIKFIRN